MSVVARSTKLPVLHEVCDDQDARTSRADNVIAKKTAVCNTGTSVRIIDTASLRRSGDRMGSPCAKTRANSAAFEEVPHAVPCSLEIVMLLRLRSVFPSIYSRHIRSEARIEGRDMTRTGSEDSQQQRMTVHLHTCKRT